MTAGRRVQGRAAAGVSHGYARRYAPEGTLDRRIALPVLKVTSVMFGRAVNDSSQKQAPARHSGGAGGMADGQRGPCPAEA